VALIAAPAWALRQQQHATGGFLNATPTSGGAGEAVG
jgi:hypothetical protein